MTLTQISRDHSLFDDHPRHVTGTPSLDGHYDSEAQTLCAVESFSADHGTSDTQRGLVGGPSSERQVTVDAHVLSALGTSLPPASELTIPTAPAREEPFSDHDATLPSTPSHGARRGPILYSGYLCLLSDTLDGIEDLRIATENRVRSLTRTGVDKDGELRGLGLDARSPEVATAQMMLDSLKQLEHQATLTLQKELRKSPLYGWVKRSKGIGAKQAARLLAVIGDPYWNDLHDRPRTVSELWAYAGYSVIGGTAQRRRKGVQANWNDKAKMRAYLMAESCMKSLGGDYRAVYDAARSQYADAVHPHDCVRCGPAGKPALAGSPLSAGHQHARALRRVAKEILKDLWREARTIHEAE